MTRRHSSIGSWLSFRLAAVKDRVRLRVANCSSETTGGSMHRIRTRSVPVAVTGKIPGSRVLDGQIFAMRIQRVASGGAPPFTLRDQLVNLLLDVGHPRHLDLELGVDIVEVGHHDFQGRHPFGSGWREPFASSMA